jgi:glycosyltransferase involved in cell wall biosynthesis
MIKVCYFTSKPFNDTRVFQKECKSLYRAGYIVHLVTPSVDSGIIEGINVLGIDFNRKLPLSRFFILPYQLYKVACGVDADIYHFNDPASIPYGLLLKCRRKKVIFDSFEDHPLLLFENRKRPYLLNVLLSWMYSKFEYYACKRFDAVICCYHWTQERLAGACSTNDLIFNFPVVDINQGEDQSYGESRTDKDLTLCYAGLISDIWNLKNLFSSISNLDDVKFIIAGHGDHNLIERYATKEFKHKVKFKGSIRPERVYEIVYSQSDVGLALLDYLPLCKGNIGNMSNNKLFEYLKFGLPVICTDFVLWKEVVEKYNCGICVNPNNLDEIVSAIAYFKSNPGAIKVMGENGKRIVSERFNWSNEEIKLLRIYAQLSGDLI